MKQLSYEEYRNWSCDNVVAVTIDDDAIKAFGFVDFWYDALENRTEDFFHILLLESDRLGEDWLLNREIVYRRGFGGAVSELAGFRCGGMFFEHEEDYEMKNAFEDLYSIFDSTCECSPKIVRLQKNEYVEFLNSARGPYIVIEDKDWQNWQSDDHFLFQRSPALAGEELIIRT